MIVRVGFVFFLAFSLLSSTAARAEMERDPVRRILDVGNFPLFPMVGSTFGWALSDGLWTGAKAVAGTTAIGMPVAIAMAALGQSAIGIGPVDWTKAIASGAGSTLLPLAVSALTGPMAPIVYMGLSFGGSYAAQWLLDWWRDRQSRAAQARAGAPAVAPGGPGTRTASAPGFGLLGVSGAQLSQ